MKTNVISAAIAVAAVVVLALGLRHQPWSAHRIVGAAIALVALALILLARVQLGRSFSISAQAHHLVTTGLYSRIRNPIYVFAEVFTIGVAIFLWSWWLVAVVLISVPLQAKRARREAAVLEQAFGDEYRRYRDKTWF